MKNNLEELRGLLKTASEQVVTAQSVITELATQVQELQHKLASRDIALKLASMGQVAAPDLPEKVAELEQKSPDDLLVEEKLASRETGHSHSLHSQQGVHSATGAMDFLNPR